MNGFQIYIVKSALDHLEDLSEADNDFIQNIAGYDNDRKLSKPQRKWLNDIAKKLERL